MVGVDDGSGLHYNGMMHGGLLSSKKGEGFLPQKTSIFLYKKIRIHVHMLPSRMSNGSNDIQGIGLSNFREGNMKNRGLVQEKTLSFFGTKQHLSHHGSCHRNVS